MTSCMLLIWFAGTSFLFQHEVLSSLGQGHFDAMSFSDCWIPNTFAMANLYF